MLSNDWEPNMLRHHRRRRRSSPSPENTPRRAGGCLENASTMENMKNSELSALPSIWLSVYFEINADFPPYFMKRAVTAVPKLATHRAVPVSEGGDHASLRTI